MIFCLPSGRDSYLNNKIAAGFESGLCTDLILINLQNAFDTVNNNVLLKKKDFIGLYEEKAKWFKSYLSNRKIKVLIKSTFSEPGNYFNAEFLKDPFYDHSFFFYIYIYIYIYMPQAADCELLIYANDICLIFQHKGITEIDNGTKQKFLYNL